MKITLGIIFCLIVSVGYGQTNLPTERFIEVTGEGEVKVDPNIIHLSIELREYKKDGKIVYGEGKMGTNRVDFEQIKLTYKIVVKFRVE